MFDLHTNQQELVGQQEVIFPNRTGGNLDEIVFRLYPNLPQYSGLMGIGRVWLDGQPKITFLRADGTSLVIPLDQPLPPQASVAISLTFEVQIPHQPKGYVLFGHSHGVWSLPDAYPLLAVHDGSLESAGPELTWHEDLAPPFGDAVFADAALYDVTLTVPATMTVATTGSVISDVARGDGRREVRVADGPLREFTWLASADYAVAETTACGARVRSYYLPGDEAAGQAALNTAAAALRVYADTFGPYPFAELVIAEAPLRHYGMEYPGLNLIGWDLYRERRSELEDRVVHELAHQWWYAQVGNDQVRTPWLDEGLAEHSTSIYYRDVFGEERANTLVQQRWLVPYQAAVENGYDAVVNQPTAAFDREYEVIVYGKGALFFEALRERLGEDLFRAVLREYVDQYRWRIATPDGFLRLAQSVSGQGLEDLYDHWILSKR
jgi:hypothetical protein